MPILPKTPDLDAQLQVLMREALDDREAGDRPHHALDPINLERLKTALGETKLFRILMTNACVFDCAYCPMRAGRAMRRLYVPPERLARVFLHAVRRGWAEGLFVTTAIAKNPVWIMDRMIALVEIVRERHGFAGYIHAKAMPEAEPAQLARLAQLVDRLSFNLESPCESALHQIAPRKTVAAGLAALARTAAMRSRARAEARPGARVALRSGATTQLVITRDGPDDAALLGFTEGLYAKGHLHHTHYAAFRPIAGTPMEHDPETPIERERRLYEADYLMRQYGFASGELPYENGRLPLGIDVKLAWALGQPQRFPVELMTADRETLLRVPGLGPRGVDRLLAIRRVNPPRDEKELARLGFALKRCLPFVTLRGKRIGGPSRLQLPLFAGAEITPAKHLYSVSPGTFR